MNKSQLCSTISALLRDVIEIGPVEADWSVLTVAELEVLEAMLGRVQDSANSYAD